MERPKIKDSKIAEYVEYLEGRLEKFEANKTIARYYVGLKKQIDDISNLFQEIEVCKEDLHDKEDKFFDRYFKYLEKSDQISESLIKLEKKVAPSKEKERIRDDATVEKHIFSNGG